MSGIFSTEILNDGSLPSFDDMLKNGGAMATMFTIDNSSNFTSPYQYEVTSNAVPLGIAGDLSVIVTSNSLPNSFPADYTYTTPGGDQNQTGLSTSWPVVPITIEGLQNLIVETNISTYPPPIIVSPEIYDQLKPAWGQADDNEGLIVLERRTAELARLKKLEEDILLAILEPDPIQDRCL